jgi:hypothetical protein
MSFDLTITHDRRYSRSKPREALDSFLAQMPGVQRNGTSGFVLNPTPSVWMEIYCEAVDHQGDTLTSETQNHSSVNCVRLHIPYRFLRRDLLETEYLPLAFAITKHLRWRLYDEQDKDPDNPIYPEGLLGWKLWRLIVGIICIGVALVVWSRISGPTLPAVFVLLCLIRYAYRKKKRTK